MEAEPGTFSEVGNVRWASRFFSAFGIFLTGAAASAQSVRHLSIQSKVDTFELVLNGTTASVNSKPADISSIHDFLQALRDPLSSDCPVLKEKPDVTVKEDGQIRFIYLKQGVVSDGKNCLSVSGDGLLYFPIHRDFLIGAKHDGITLKSPIKIFRQGIKLLEIKKDGQNWVAEGTDLLLNWDFIERLQNSLKSFDVRFRILPDPNLGKPKMILQSGDQTFEFYKVTNVLWALKKPAHPWLETSDDWSFWYEFENDVLEDRFAAQIHFFDDATKDKAARLAALDKLDGSWSRNLRDLYHKFILNKNEDEKIKAIAFKRLRAKPSKETAAVMAQFLAEGDDEIFKKQASQILKINYPKGPIYNPDASPAERAKVVEYWSHYRTEGQKSP